MKKLVVILFFILSVANYAGVGDSTATVSYPLRVDSIKITGNDITEEFIILRELSFNEGMVIDSADINYNSERVYSLGLFNFVELNTDKVDDKNIVNINVKEAWYIYPIPFFNLQENSLSKSRYGLDITYKNFRGRNETIRAKTIFGYNPAFVLSYHNPVFLYKEQVSFNVSFTYGKVASKSDVAEYYYGDEFDYRYIMSQIFFGKRFNIYNDVYMGLGFKYVEPPEKRIPGITASGEDIDRVPFASFQFVHDTRDLKQFSNQGNLTSVSYNYVGFGLNGAEYHVLASDLRQYTPIIGDLVNRTRLVTRNTFGKHVPYYDKSYLGYSEYVRGYKGVKTEGDNYVTLSTALKYPIVKEWKLSFKLPWIPRRLTSARIGLSLIALSDVGTVYNNGSVLSKKRFQFGYGGGLALIFLPHAVTIFEYGVNRENVGEFFIVSAISF